MTVHAPGTAPAPGDGSVARLSAPGWVEGAVRERARRGAAAVFPDPAGYGSVLHGAPAAPAAPADQLDALRLVPPVFVPHRLERMLELGEEPLPQHVELETGVGGFRAPLPVYVSAFGSTRVAASDLGTAVARQAGRLGVPMVIGENVVPVGGYGRLDGERAHGSLLARITAYREAARDTGLGGVVVQQSTQDADAEVWNLVYSDPTASGLLDEGRLAFELKVGQGAKPGLGGLTLLSRSDAARLAEQYRSEELYGPGSDTVLRHGTPGTFTEEILRQQVRLMRNNYPRARVWVKLPPGRDVGEAARTAWEAGADAVTVDGAEGGSGWAPTAFLDQVGLPLAECLSRVPARGGALLASGRMWEGGRAVKCLALGARAVGLGRAALLAADEDPEEGLVRLLDALALELRLLLSALGKYRPGDLAAEDLWLPQPPFLPAQAPAFPPYDPFTTR
ncbi:glutamate synthase-related protein [Streptomyces termitum]|uniref:glutamate synthase-related protein n=1 Tax=Streptomyces termitum TaxID=67368 RepID=UPI0033ABA43A